MSIEVEVTQKPTGPDAPPAPKPDRPDWLPEGFETPEDFRASYDKLQPAQPKQDEPKAKTEAPPKADPKADEQVAKFVEGVGLDVRQLTEQVATTGTIEPEAMGKLEAAVEKAGLPKGMVQEYIQGQQAIADSFKREIFSIAGGEDGYAQLADWARQSLPEEDLRNFSDLMETGDFEKAKFAVRSLVSQYKANNRTPGKLLKGSSPASGGDVFHSQEEQIAAQSDPRYRTDPAFRRQIEEKIDRTFKFYRG